jgi:hypothetical protein
MDTLLLDLRSALQTLSDHPAFTLAAAVSLGFGLESIPRSPAPGRERHAASAPHSVALPKRSVSWMDYIDFRRGSGDVLRWIGPSTLDDPPEHPDHPHTCGAGE